MISLLIFSRWLYVALYSNTAMLIRFTPMPASVSTGNFGVATIFTGSGVAAMISLATSASGMAMTNKPSAPACWSCCT